jgi:hypothetical protein
MGKWFSGGGTYFSGAFDVLGVAGYEAWLLLLGLLLLVGRHVLCICVGLF